MPLNICIWLLNSQGTTKLFIK